ncbi:hypothetical protein H9M94_03080 [Mycoplasma sp. Pen4]|uniref:hypothetical protein n=1 Tax=Mycoplasma sp. Pen4 TaxID=640330 RepID=UPI001654BABA|nr:hypothetical protein [Mycoplasma sp. Pen4]QNM93563.1 hypothetical protein H9M94_03080 [Mycoplasma sp. Pen4]
MKIYYKGTVFPSKHNKITMDVNNVGYLINVINSEHFIPWEKQKVYITEIQKDIYGFRTFNENIMFQQLTQPKDISPYKALTILRDNDLIDLCKAIVNEDYNKLLELKLSEMTLNRIFRTMKKTALYVLDSLREKTPIQNFDGIIQAETETIQNDEKL